MVPGYDDTCSAAVLNEFSSAAFRFGHSLIRPKLFRMGVNFGERNPHIQLRNSFFNSDMLFDVRYKPGGECERTNGERERE